VCVFRYSHVNKKAADQYINFTDQREGLLRRKSELDDGNKAILELIESLDRKKDEAIERTFKTVAKHFRVVFKELVSSGVASLIMQTRDPSMVSVRERPLASPRSLESVAGVAGRVAAGDAESHQPLHGRRHQGVVRRGHRDGAHSGESASV
jgi:structural maintenance of chromosome 3 (chondroitin sulfate proteoglycan 6)